MLIWISVSLQKMMGEFGNFLLFMPRKQKIWTLNPEQDIFTTPIKARGMWWKKGQKEYMSQKIRIKCCEVVFWACHSHGDYDFTAAGIAWTGSYKTGPLSTLVVSGKGLRALSFPVDNFYIL